MIITREEAKDYLRIERDFTEEDALVDTLVIASEDYLKSAVGAETFDAIALDEGKKAKAKILCLALVTDWHENGLLTGKNSEKIRPVLQSIINQLKYAGSDA